MKKGTKVQWMDCFGQFQTGRIIEILHSDNERDLPVKVRPDDPYRVGKKRIALKLKSVTEIPDDYK